MKLIKSKLLAIKDKISEYRKRKEENKKIISTFLESDLNEDYIAYCNKVLLSLNYIDEPLNENGLKLFILFRQEYLFTDEEIKSICQKLCVKTKAKVLKV